MFDVIWEVNMCLRIFTLSCKHEYTHLSIHSFLRSPLRGLLCPPSHAVGDMKVKEVRTLVSRSLLFVRKLINKKANQEMCLRRCCWCPPGSGCCRCGLLMVYTCPFSRWSLRDAQGVIPPFLHTSHLAKPEARDWWMEGYDSPAPCNLWGALCRGRRGMILLK